MKCPVCKTDTINPVALDNQLPAGKCIKCGGVWISSNQYMTWLRLQPERLPEKKADEPFDPTWETSQLKLCPDCGRIMSRYQLFPNEAFFLDRCGHCNGIWFDNHEWEYLASRNLQDKLNQFFTAPWQGQLHKQEKHARMETLYIEKFGQADYVRLREVREWVWKHPHTGMLLAFLQAEDPYQ